MALSVFLNLHELPDKSDHTWEFTLAEKNLVDEQLLINLFFVILNVFGF